METITLEHIPVDYAVHLNFFRDVQNAAFLHSQLLYRNADFEYAFIDASVVVSRRQILAAIYKALTLLLDGSLKTPNVHSEIVASLSPSSNVCHDRAWPAHRRYRIRSGDWA
jgi:EKC/KEOPS complex subunit CGI121/TPRKB